MITPKNKTSYCDVNSNRKSSYWLLSEQSINWDKFLMRGDPCAYEGKAHFQLQYSSKTDISETSSREANVISQVCVGEI